MMRMRLFGGVLVGALLCTTAVQAQGADTRFEDGSRPEWTARPNHADTWRDMEDAGLSRSDVGQWAIVVCTVGDNRRLGDCRISQESSPETEVGDAILLMSRRYRSASNGRDGQPAIGRRVYLAMGYGGINVP